MKICRFHPGESVLFQFTLGIPASDVSSAIVSFRNENHVAFEAKVTSFVEAENGCKFGFILAQAESLQFEEKSKYSMQINVYVGMASRIVSKEFPVETGAQHITEVGVGGGSIYMYDGDASLGIIDYTTLANKPSINDVTLINNRDLPERTITTSQLDEIMAEKTYTEEDG